MLDTTTREVVKMTLTHSGSNVQEFYAALPGPVRVGIEATERKTLFVRRRRSVLEPSDQPKKILLPRPAPLKIAR